MVYWHKNKVNVMRAVLVIGNQHEDVQDTQTGTVRVPEAFHAR